MKRVKMFVLTAAFCLGLLAGCAKVPGAEIPSKDREQAGVSESLTKDPSQQTQEDPSKDRSGSGTSESSDLEQTEENGRNADAVDDYMTTIDGMYAIAYVTDGGGIRDGARNQSVWEGVKEYAYQSGKSYKSYQTYGGDAARDDDRYDAMKEAIRGGAELVICAGPEHELALRRIAQEYPQVQFMFLEGIPVKDLHGNTIPNIFPITFREDQIGYLAGYAAVKDGRSKVGFLGDQTRNSQLCGYGFLQGANAAAAETGASVTVNYHTEKKAQDTPELREMLKSWYADDTELIFTSGQTMWTAAAAVAAETPERVASSELQQKNSEYRICVNRSLRDAAWDACEAFYRDGMGKGMVLGAENDALGLVTDPWNLEDFSLEDYQTLFQQLKNGAIELQEEASDSLSQDMFGNITLNLE